ncbi:MAG: alpha-L-glutamate ligase, partial [Gammaproteobacteria bacterium]
MSASSHSRNHRYEPELALGILEWLQRHNRKVINGSRALDLEISKIRQYQELEKFNIQTPPTFASVRKNFLLEGAEKI